MPDQHSFPREHACLAEIDKLKGELHRARLAISTHSVQELEESLWQQKMLCSGVKNLLQNLQGVVLSESALESLRSSMEALAVLNGTYAKLVKQANASNTLLYSLCTSYKDQPNRERQQLGAHCSLEA